MRFPKTHRREHFKRLLIVLLCFQMVVPSVLMSPAQANPIQGCDTGIRLPCSQAPAPENNSGGVGRNMGSGQEFSGDDDIGGQGWGGEGSGLGAPGPAGIGVGGGTGDTSVSGGGGLRLLMLKVAVIGTVMLIFNQIGSCPDDDDDTGRPPKDKVPSPERPRTTEDPIDILRGTVTESARDLDVLGPLGSWRSTRSYSSLPGMRSIDTKQGVGWLNSAVDLRLRLIRCGEMPPKKIGLIETAGTKIVFEKKSYGYVPCVSTDYELRAIRIDSDVYNYRVTNTDTDVLWIFNRFGSLIETTSTSWEAAGKIGFIHSENTNSIVTPEGQEYHIFWTHDPSDRIKTMHVANGTTVLQKAEYTYFSDEDPNTAHDSSVGTVGDLVQVKLTRLTSDGLGNYDPNEPTIDDPNSTVSRYTQYRYDGRHCLVAIFNHDGIFSLINDNSNINSPDDILQKASGDSVGSGTNSKVVDFADRLYEYYSNDEDLSSIATVFEPGGERLPDTYMLDLPINIEDIDETGRVKRGIDRPNGCASCGSSSSGVKYDYYYMARNIHGSGAGFNDVVWITVEDVSDPNDTPIRRRVWGLNSWGHVLREVTIESPTTTPQYWCSSRIFNEKGYIVSHRLNSAHTEVITAGDLKIFLDPSTDSNDALTLNNTTGLIWNSGFGFKNRHEVASVQKGETGAAHNESSGDYGPNGSDVRPSRIYTGTGAYSSYVYTAWGEPADNRIKQRKIIPPVVDSTQNGSGEPTHQYEYYDQSGRLRWTKNGDGYVTYRAYSHDRGLLAYQMRDVDTLNLSDEIKYGGLGWEAWENEPVPEHLCRANDLPAALEYVTKNEYDDLARIVKRIYPGGDSTHLKYEKYKTITFKSVDSSGVPAQPVIVRVWDDYHRNTAVYTVDPAKTVIVANRPVGIDDSNQDDFLSLTRRHYDPVSGALTQIDRYHNVPGAGNGVIGTNFYSTSFLYTPLGKRGAIIQYVDTNRYQVTATLYDDVHGRPIETRTGVATSPPDDYDDLDNAITGSPPSGFVGYARIATIEYDGGGIGDGQVTSRKSFYGTDASDYIQTTMYYTYRGHLRGTKRSTSSGDITPYTVFDVDWMGRTTGTAAYTTEPNWGGSVLSDDGYTDYIPGSSSPHDRSVVHYDDLGRVYRTETYPGTEDTKHFESNNYYDRRGNLVASGTKHNAHTETAYDGVGRPYQQRTVTHVASTAYPSGEFQYRAPKPMPNVDSMPSAGDDGLIAFTHTDYNPSGRSIARHMFELNHDDLNGIDIDAPDSYVRASNYSWYDKADRVRTVANYGSGDGTGAGGDSWNFTSLPSPDPNEPDASTNAILVTKFEYYFGDDPNTTVTEVGRNDSVVDPAGSKTKTYYDDSGRSTYVAENHNDFLPASSGIGGGTNGDQDRVTAWVYNGSGQVTDLTAYNGSSANDQVTEYRFEDHYNARLATMTIYPDGDAEDDNVQRTYNLDGSLVTMADQRAVVHTYTYSDRRQVIADQITGFGDLDPNQSFGSITRKYDNLGQLTHLTSHGNATNDPNDASDIENQIVYTSDPIGPQDPLGKISKSEQSHDGAVTMGTPNVRYIYDTSDTSDVLDDGMRLKWVQYPVVEYGSISAGVNYDYGTADSIDDRLNRVYFQTTKSGAFLSGDVPFLSYYSYNGTSRLVKTQVNGSSVERTDQEMFGSTAGDYDAWDRFGRTLQSKWKTFSETVQDQVDYTYDYAGNRLSRDVYNSTALDQGYTYDGLSRLKEQETGEWSSGSISNLQEREIWLHLDHLGNWHLYGKDSNGNGTYKDPADRSQTRTHNEANELVTIHQDYQADWVTVAHDAAGNMTTIPQPNDPNSAYTLVYDAWNRLVEVSDSTGVVQANEYDGINRRIVRDESGGLGELKHFYYNLRWQVLVEASDPNTATAMYSYHPQYVDAVALRIRDADMHFYLHDANYNVTAMMDGAGTVVERYSYTPYGEVTVLASDFSPLISSQIDNEYLYTGRRLDPETGLQLNRNRFYAAGLGRWVNRDPIGYRGGVNLYGYVDSNPIDNVDPRGTLIAPPIAPPVPAVACSAAVGGGHSSAPSGSRLCASRCYLRLL